MSTPTGPVGGEQGASDGLDGSGVFGSAGSDERQARRGARRQARHERRAALDAEIDAELEEKTRRKRRPDASATPTPPTPPAPTAAPTADSESAVAHPSTQEQPTVPAATGPLDPPLDERQARRQARRERRAAVDAEIDAELDAEVRRKRGAGDDDLGVDASPAGPARLEIRGVVVDFGGLRAVDTVSVSVEPGTITGLIGANGSGKTTLLDTVSGQVMPTEGSILVDGRDMVDFLPEERARMGMVRSFQDCRLYPELSVEDTLLLCEDARHRVDVLSTTLQLPWARRNERDKRRAVDRVIASFGLERFRNHLTGHLSTGTRRVVDLASIVLAGPRLLLLDEPTAGIAQREAEAFIPLLHRLHEVTGATILLVEHDVPLVFALCSTVVVMQTGTVVTSGDPDTVRQDPRALAAYLGASDAALNVSGPVRSAPAG